MRELVTCWTGKDFYSAPAPLREVEERLRDLDLNAVLVFSSVSGVLLGFWKRHSLNRLVYNTLIEWLYPPEMAGGSAGQMRTERLTNIMNSWK
jgi:hypothetical protein